MNETETIERPARPPSKWGLAAMGVGALVFGVVMGLGPLAFPNTDAAILSTPTFAGIGASQVWFACALFRELFKPTRDRTLTVVETGTVTRFRNRDSAGHAGLMALLVMSFAWILIAFVIIGVVRTGVVWLAAAGWTTAMVVSCAAYAVQRRRVESGLRDYVIDRDAGVLHIPPRFVHGRLPRLALQLSGISSLTYFQGVLNVRSKEALTPLWHSGLVTPSEFDAARWIAAELGVPLLDGTPPLSSTAPTLFRAASAGHKLLVSRAGIWVLYLLLLMCSYAWEHYRAHSEIRYTQPNAPSAYLSNGEHLAYRVWPVQAGALGPEARANPVPVVLIHGSPGRAADFDRMARPIRDAGYRVLAPDLPGFGQTARDAENDPEISAAAHARAVLRWMDALHIGRAHVVGWSLGGAVAMHMADAAPERVASMTLLASVSEQAMEGSGSFVFEHLKYAAGWVLATAVRHGVPHFGALSWLDAIRASMRNFWETDIRPLAGIMARLNTPTMILHGWRDFLVPARAAERSHELIGPSTLVMLDASHFIPFLQANEAAAVLVPFFARHDEPGVAGLRQSALAPRPVGAVGASGAWAARLVERVPWWVSLMVIAAAVWRRPRIAAALAGVLVGFMLVDFGVAAAGVLAGLGIATCLAWTRGARGDSRVIGSGLHARTRADWDRLIRARPVLSGLGAGFTPGGRDAHAMAAGALRLWRAWPGTIAGWVVWTVVFFVVPVVATGAVAAPLGEAWGVAGLALGLAAAAMLPRVLGPALTRMGRAWLRITFHRATRREYWPTLVQYLGLAPVFVRMAARHGGATFTCCNPGIPGGGGIVGESKTAILDALGGSPLVLPAVLIGARADAGERADEALRAIASRPELGGFPVILKPDAGQRGFAVKVARGEDDVRAYFGQVRSPVIVQRYHAGPRECGIVWVRGGAGGRVGRIFSITRKEFPVVVGDGRRTLEELILRHPRFHCQAAVFFERMAAERSRVLGEGERVRLAQSGNHCQGTKFTDGADLITPDLERVIDGFAAGFASPLDMCRFDMRYETDEGLRRGEGLAVVELNGTTGESTNIYDPGKSIAWAYGVLAEQWRLLYELGAARRKAGVKPMGLLAVVREARRQVRERSGPAVAD